jgi:hypothetical protein
MHPIHSDLPIVTPDPHPRGGVERFGGLFYLGLGGLIVVGALLVWFIHGAWSLRDVFSRIYVLHDPREPADTRVFAARALSRDPRVTQSQLWDIALRRDLPPLARYLVAESLTAEIVAADPRAYAEAVAYSPNWPAWLRLLAVRPLAYAAIEGFTLPSKPLSALRENPDPAVQLWAACAQAETQGRMNSEARDFIEREARRATPYAELARLLRDASTGRAWERRALLDDATRWQRLHHAQSAEFWRGWEERDGHLRRRPVKRRDSPLPTPEQPQAHPVHRVLCGSALDDLARLFRAELELAGLDAFGTR